MLFDKLGALNDLLDVERLDQIISYLMRSANNDIINILVREDHKDSFVKRNNREVITLVLTHELVIKDPYNQERSHRLCFLNDFNVRVMQHIEVSINVDNHVVSLRFLIAAELPYSSARSQEDVMLLGLLLRVRRHLPFRFVNCFLLDLNKLIDFHRVGDHFFLFLLVVLINF